MKNLTFSCGILLDVGCSTGRHVAPLTETGLRIVGIDTNRAYVKAAKEITDHRGLNSSVDLAIADGNHLPFTDSLFDVVFAWGMFWAMLTSRRKIG